MQRAVTIVLALAAIALAAVLAAKSAPTHEATPETTRALVDAGGTSDGAASGSSASSLASDDDSGSLAPMLAIDLGDGGLHMADGTPIAMLATGSPKQVRFGVVLVTYEGAQGAPAKGARSKKDALALATKLADDAKSDFHAAVAKGDSGSADDAGSVPRGVLEPGPEAVLFALPVGGTSGVVDTPRGFWIVKRIE